MTNNTYKQHQTIGSFFMKFFREKGLSVYKFTFILIIACSLLSISIVSIAWAISEKNQVQNEISLLKERAIEKQKEKLNDEIRSLISYLKFIQQDSIQYSQQQLQDKALSFFESIRFGNDGYIFVNTYNGEALLFNGKKLEIPKKMSNLNYPTEIDFYKTEMDLAKLPNGGSFQYNFMKLNDKKQYPKMSYIMGYNQWEWILGAGDYLDNLDNEIVLLEQNLKSNLYNRILVAIGVFILFLILIVLFSVFLAKKLQNQFDKFVTIIKNHQLGDNNQLPFNQIYLRELRSIGMDIIKAEERVKQFGNIIDQLNNMILIFDKNDFKLIHVNQGVIRKCGYKLDELKKMVINDILPKMSKEHILALVNPLNDNKANEIHFETIFQQKNNINYPVEVQITSSIFNTKEVYVAFVNDISERKKAELNLLESEGKFKSLFEYSTIGILIADDASFYLDANPSICKMLGYTRQELIGMHGKDIVSPAEIENINPALHTIKTKDFYYKEWQFKRKDGSIFIADVSVSNMPDGNLIAMINDITDRKKSEISIIKNQERLLEAERIGRLGNWTYEVENSKISWSEGMYVIFGRSREKDDLSYDNIISWVHLDDREKFNLFFDYMLTINPNDDFKSIDYRLLRPDGEERWVKARFECDFDKNGNPKQFISTLIDITESKQAEELLKESEAYAKHLFEYAAIPIWVEDFSKVKESFNELSEQGVNDFSEYFNNNEEEVKRIASLVEITQINNKNLELYEVTSKEELLGNFSDWFNKESWSVFKDNLIAFAEGRYSFESEISITTRNNEIKRLIINVNAHPDYVDTLKIVFVSLIDITDREKAEEELSKYRESLEEIVNERTLELGNSQEALLNLVDDLNIQTKKLEDTNKMLANINTEMETFTYSVSHDLKAPLRGIDGYSNLLYSKYKDQLDEEALNFLINIKNGTGQMNVLIEDLLAYSRMEREEFESTEINLKTLVDNILLNYSETIKIQNIKINCTFNNVFLLQTDKKGLTVVMRNLIENAIKFSKPNKQSEIEIGGFENEEKWHIFVKDNGIGFDMKYHDRIYKIFQRLHLQEEYGGTGIGLAMVYKAIQRMSGKVWAKSTLNNGACFYIEIYKNNYNAN